MGLGAPPVPEGTPGVRDGFGQGGGPLPGADLSPAVILVGARDGAGSGAAHQQDSPLAGGWGVTLPPRQHGKGVPWLLLAAPVPSTPHQPQSRDL